LPKKEDWQNESEIQRHEEGPNDMEHRAIHS